MLAGLIVSPYTPIPFMETSLNLSITADELKRRFLRACELKQEVNWERIVKCIERWAFIKKIDASAIVRIEGVEHLKETARQAWEVQKTKMANHSLNRTNATMITQVAIEAWKASKPKAARAAWNATGLWTTADAKGAMIRLQHSGANAEAKNLGPSAVWNLTSLSLGAFGATAQDIGKEAFAEWQPLFEAFEAGAYCFFLTDRGIELCTLPNLIHTDDQGLLHSASGPAFVWLNDIRDYYWHGVHVDAYVVDNPERITQTDLEMEFSQEVRRVKIERFSLVRSKMEVPRISQVTVEELKERYKHACTLKQAVNWEKIVKCFQLWAAGMNIEASAIVRVEGAEQLSAAAIILEKPLGLRLPHGSPGSQVAFDAKLAKEAGLEWSRNITGAAHAASQLWHTRACWGIGKTWTQWNPSWMCLIAIGALELGMGREFFIWYPLFEAFEAGAYCFYLTDRGIEVCTPPSLVRTDDQRRLHSASGPAFVWLNDIQDYYWHGVHVDSYVVDNPERITVADIEGESNAEVRRVKIERFGQARYLVESGAREIHRDDFGTLYSKHISGDEPLLMVKVVNTTIEPDGSFKDYFLRVPPTMRTARAAVAWTFGKSPEDYNPSKET